MSYFRQRGIRERVEIEYFTREPEPTGEAHDPVVWMDAESKRRNIKQNYEFVVRRHRSRAKREFKGCTITNYPMTC